MLALITKLHDWQALIVLSAGFYIFPKVDCIACIKSHRTGFVYSASVLPLQMRMHMNFFSLSIFFRAPHMAQTQVQAWTTQDTFYKVQAHVCSVFLWKRFENAISPSLNSSAIKTVWYVLSRFRSGHSISAGLIFRNAPEVPDLHKAYTHLWTKYRTGGMHVACGFACISMVMHHGCPFATEVCTFYSVSPQSCSTCSNGLCTVVA